FAICVGENLLFLIMLFKIKIIILLLNSSVLRGAYKWKSPNIITLFLWTQHPSGVAFPKNVRLHLYGVCGVY
ncbi:hypothetical protein, partial [Maribacter cobaltidurans]|uniref:hypothetical protein n=1 Tax=Maribacter cobaltidurans TaxID=1178778 RepID=UPI001E3EC575